MEIKIRILDFFCVGMEDKIMKETDIDIVELMINNIPGNTEIQKRIKLYMQMHKNNCNNYIYNHFQKETTFFNSIFKALICVLSAEIISTIK